MLAVIRREAIYLWYYFSIQFHQIVPYWVIGMVIGSLVSVFLKEPIHRMMSALHGKLMGTWGIIPASALGILSLRFVCMGRFPSWPPSPGAECGRTGSPPL